MIEHCRFHISSSLNPYENLAKEEFFLDHLAPGEVILYLWQNQKTVVIGRNQNAWKECSLRLLKEDGGHLARRLSGGGAVYHDLGNVNFTFLAKRGDYDVARQLDVILMALARHGIPAVKSGRNDLVITGEEENFAGRKFSGNAFYRRGENAFHHGTIMLGVDREVLGRYLSPSLEKLAAKGVASVRSRVVNLQSMVPELTVSALQESLLAAFETEYGKRAAEIGALPAGEIDAAAQRYGDERWLLGPKGGFSIAFGRRFPWGELEIGLETNGGVITKAAVYSDAMDSDLIADIAPRFQGLRADVPCCDRALAGLEANADPEGAAILRDIRQYLGEQLAADIAPHKPKDRP